jgi:hypothetical protein
LAGGGGDDTGGVSNIVFLLGGDVEVYPLPLLPLCLVEDTKSSEWPVAALWCRILLEGVILSLWEGVMLRLV